jgi:hypothetical protein
MKTISMAMALSVAACLLLMSPLRADGNNNDKGKKNTTSPATQGPEKAKKIVRNIQQSDPPKVSSTTRTPEQAAKEYMESGPFPAAKNNPMRNRDVQNGFDNYQQKHKRITIKRRTPRLTNHRT